MSVLIRGMKMPESCIRCRLRGGSYGTFCKALNEYIDDTSGVSRDKRMDNCPLVEIPDMQTTVNQYGSNCVCIHNKGEINIDME